MRHINIPIFIPHLGCPNACVFCNQRTISGKTSFSKDLVKEEIEASLSTASEDDVVEIAFFGGSFTGIDREQMRSLLEIGNEYIKQGRVASLRCSTRPDYIDEEVLSLLSSYGMKTVELGIQSVSDEVLRKSKRGHTFSDTERACRLVVASGMSLVGQMMIGLPGSTPESEIETADFLIASGACAARIYPVVVFRGTELFTMSVHHEYQPLSLPEAVERSVNVLERFDAVNLPVLRIGLCASEGLTDSRTVYGGPNHPALGELVFSELYYRKIRNLLKHTHLKNDPTVLVANGAISQAVGHRKKNKLRLEEEFAPHSVRFLESGIVQGREIMLLFDERTDKCT